MRPYITWLGAFPTRDSLKNIHTPNLYAAHFAPNESDPFGAAPYSLGDWNQHHWFPQRKKLKKKLWDKCGLILGITDVDEFVDQYVTYLPGPWEIGGTHYNIEYGQHNKYHLEVENIYDESTTCCDLLKSIKNAISDYYTTAMNIPDKTFPPLCPYNSPQQQPVTPFDLLIEIACGMKPPHIPAPAPAPVANPVSLPESLPDGFLPFMPTPAPFPLPFFPGFAPAPSPIPIPL